MVSPMVGLPRVGRFRYLLRQDGAAGSIVGRVPADLPPWLDDATRRAAAVDAAAIRVQAAPGRPPPEPLHRLGLLRVETEHLQVDPPDRPFLLNVGQVQKPDPIKPFAS